MKELFVLGVVVFFSVLTYWLVEPFAHGQMHKHVDSHQFQYADLPAVTKQGNVAAGKDLVMGAGACSGCHSIEADGVPAMMEPDMAAASYGVNPPDLSNAGAIYDAKFLADLIKNPAHALMVEHKFDPASGAMHPMVPFYGAGGDMDQEVADMVAYLQSIAVKPSEVTSKMAFENACGRCHAMKYANWTQMGETPKFKYKKDALRYEARVLDYQDSLKKYMGKLPPDLSMYTRSRNHHFLSTFIEDPQVHLAGTAMPRVGVTADGADKVLTYLEEVGDPSKANGDRDRIGMYVMIFSLIFAIFAYLWKREIWKDLH
jgi:ubiquinol-cytochrome c reductase cytochrome c1 subunit